MSNCYFCRKSFEANSDKVYTFDGLSYSSSLQTEKQDALNSKPSTYIKGADLDSLSFKVKLDAAFWNKSKK